MRKLLVILLLLTSCSQDPQNQRYRENTLRLTKPADPESLDPRKVRDATDGSLLAMLFEGLMRIDAQGQLVPGMAESVTVSPDQLTYTFQLRHAFWSSGEPVTSADFAYAWRSMLDPQFAAPNAFQLFSIKNAQAAKTGKAAIESVGIETPDNRTLVVHLEKPTPYFLELTAFHALFPINSSVDKQNPGWADGELKDYSSNGPFILRKWEHQNQLAMARNPRYWGAGDVKLDGVTVLTLEENTALSLFQAGDVDWVGSPLGLLPPDAIGALKQSGQLENRPAAGVQIFRINTTRPPFDNVNMRRAFALALDRQALVEHVLQGNQRIALNIVPPSSKWKQKDYFRDHDVEQARQLFAEALQEMGLTAAQLPPITLIYGNSERNQKLVQAIQQQWREAFGIWIQLEGMEPKFYYEKLGRKDYQIANGSWFADFRDPISFLELFKEKSNGTNNTEWESDNYKRLLDLSATSGPERQQLLEQAEAILMNEMPVIPVFFYTFNYMKRPEVKDVGISELGVMNVRNAHLEKIK